MKEADFQTRFSKWVKHVYKQTLAYECKIAKHGQALPFARLEPHQKLNLLNVKRACHHHKIGDYGYTNPYDGYQICEESAFVVVFFYSRGAKHFYMIDIEVWIFEETSSTRKSLTEKRAAEIGKKYVLENKLIIS